MTGASELQFVDTNILIYAYDRSAGQKHEQASALLRNLWQTGAGCLSVQVLQEFYVNVTGKVAKPLPQETAGQIVSDLSVWEIHRPGVDDVLHAIHLQDRYQLSFWDAMIVTSANQLKCGILWSEDFNPGQIYEQAIVQNPLN